ncbi:hypothetical protein V5799_004187 [Amblyomma americanum]|uniref:Uncharacterized protein n=1 Tax=Amblyomma americanum TaxID=6943 RepID=A0AAQ4D6U3_AMBAM
MRIFQNYQHTTKTRLPASRSCRWLGLHNVPDALPRLKQSHSPVHRHPRKQFCSGKSASTSTDSSLTWGSSSLMVLCNGDTEIEHSFPMVLSSEGAENTDSSCTTAVQAPQFLTKHSEQERDIAGILLELGSLKRCTENKAVQVKSGGFPKRFADMVSDKNVTTFTGLPSGAVLNALVECYKKVRPLSGRQHMSAKERIVLTLMKLKHNISTAFLRHLFDTTITTCSSIIAETAQVLSEVLKSVVMLPQKRKLLNTCQSSSVM